ncbi:uncharacterized protein LOC127833870 [Dreissena polymorpha]|uniref:Uncharacterized protein n=1 Tax=Dreissena polymorpha TaxID=45954 RepID=A0A9D4JL02_DREPO|nr:uncharacterized protein LOC127833870 [Dreissena polymorpha]KAH3815945.1 hypothetical protein DPMN_144484 [Dreissena polymorpha]
MLITIIVCLSAGLVIISVLTVLTRKEKRSGDDAASLVTQDKDIISMDIILKVIGLGHLIEQIRIKAHKITSDKPAGRLKARPGLCAEDHKDVKEYMTFLRRSLIIY